MLGECRAEALRVSDGLIFRPLDVIALRCGPP